MLSKHNNNLVRHSLARWSFSGHSFDECDVVTYQKLIEKLSRQIFLNGHYAELELLCKGKRNGKTKRKRLFHGTIFGVIDASYPAKEGMVRVVFHAYDLLDSLGEHKELKQALMSYYNNILPRKMPNGYKGMYLACVPNVGFSADILKFADELLQADGSLFDLLLAELHLFTRQQKVKCLDWATFCTFFQNSDYYRFAKFELSNKILNNHKKP